MVHHPLPTDTAIELECVLVSSVPHNLSRLIAQFVVDYHFVALFQVDNCELILEMTRSPRLFLCHKSTRCDQRTTCAIPRRNLRY